ncbi:MAG: GGDEF domain-containing protein [Sulfuricaulis sp.]|uniref:GGDEF domain-containing protein n=1 Tax=Sulfuricaulis sp. TaxID=2003553 RepID=UPI0025D06E39|nr:GGDEF domain-containing protein [Sulfuricaulis sp.]MCR4346663.1 GGDEF domain-containing protein [Sulfuricaulis sp.]
MSPRLEETRALQRFTLVFAVLALAMVGALLAWTSHVRYREFEAHQQELMRSSVQGAAGEVGIFLNELRRAARLFADTEATRLQRLMRNPEDYGLYDALQASVKSHFPEAFALTIADKNGKPYVTDFEGRVEEICVKDMRQFAADRAHSGVYVHPNNQMYHFDIMVDWERGGKSMGIFFVSFSADIVARILKHGELPGHKLMLLKRDIPDLIEITSDGVRIVLDREFKLSPEEMRRIGHSVPVEGTFWNLADMPEPGLFENARRDIWHEALTIMAMVFAVSVVMVVLLFRYHRRNKKLEYLYTHDTATGFPNRYFLLDRLQHCLHEGQQKNSSCALLLVDLGGFRMASGSFLNHRNNYLLIKEAGDRIRRTIGEVDVLAHLAGNEFAVLRFGMDAETAVNTAGAILASLKQPFTADKSVTLPKAVVGIAISPEHGEDAETLTQHATAALYAARLNASGVAIFANQA